MIKEGRFNSTIITFTFICQTVYTQKRERGSGRLLQRGGPSSPALAARASFCWMWYSWKRMEIRWVIFRYFCRHDSEQLD